MNALINAFNVSFILVEPATPENIGASARAIKTMGFNDLRLVNPCNHLDVKALTLACNSEDILKNATVFPTLATAIEGVSFVIGTTAQKRQVLGDYYDASALCDCIKNKKDAITSIAVVFGRESCGLSNAEILLCDIVSGIPLKTKYPVLNLSHAVMLYAYHLSALCNHSPAQKQIGASQSEFRVLAQTTSPLLVELGLPLHGGFHKRVMERLSSLCKEDIHILYALCKRISRAIRLTKE